MDLMNQTCFGGVRMMQGAVGAGLAAAMLLGGVAAVQAQGMQNASLEWEQRFDSAPSTARMPRSSTPILSPQTIQSTEAALQQYLAIEQQGGWPQVPQGPALKQIGRAHV